MYQSWIENIFLDQDKETKLRPKNNRHRPKNKS